VILVASTKRSLEDNLARFGGHLERNGLNFNLLKCGVVSLVTSGRQKRIKVIMEPHIRYKGALLPQIGIQDVWNYLGVQFDGVATQIGGSFAAERRRESEEGTSETAIETGDLARIHNSQVPHSVPHILWEYRSFEPQRLRY
jgi:hypothetical protein